MAVDPPDRPTERLPPVPAREPVAPGRPVAGDAYVDPAYVDPAYADGPLTTAALADAVGTLRLALALIALLSVAALALAFYALHEAQKDDAQGASRARVAKLEDRVSRLVTLVKRTRAGSGASAGTTSADAKALKQQLDGAAKASDVDTLRTSVSKLSASVNALQGSSSGGGANAGQTQSAIDALGTRIDKLSAQVQQLQSNAQPSP